MMKLKALKKRLLGDSSGATLVEFGLVAPPFFLILLGIMDLGYRGYVDTMSKSILHQVARDGSTGELTPQYIEKEIKDALAPMTIDPDQITVETVSYFDYTNIGKPEKITTDKNSDGVIDPGDCFIDNNGNEIFDTDYGINGIGGPDDIVSYTITIVRPRMFPLASMIGLEETMTISNSTAVRNQPYGDQVELVETCISDLD